MTKVLGDNPFGDPAKPESPESGDGDTRSPDARPASKAKAGGDREKRTKEAAPPRRKRASTAGPGKPSRTTEDRHVREAAEPITDEAAGRPPARTSELPPDTLPPDEAMDEVFYGEEAAPTPGDYGPGLDKRKEIPYARKSITEEVRELERRVRARLTPAFPIEHRRKLPLEFLWRRYRDLAMRDRSDVVDEFGRDPLFTDKFEPIAEFLYSKYFRTQVEGLEHIPDGGRALIVANHSGTLPYDGAMLMWAVKRDSESHRDVRPLVEDFVFHFPYLGTLINRIGGVRACQENAERLLNQDQLVAVFPEGVKGIGKLYKERYRLQRFGRGGFVKLALRTGAPIIPAAIVGAEEIHPMLFRFNWLARSIGVPYIPVTPTFPLLGPLGLMPLPARWTIRFGEPLDYGQRYGASAVDDRILVNKLAETVRSTIQEMVDDVLANRKSVLFG